MCRISSFSRLAALLVVAATINICSLSGCGSDADKDKVLDEQAAQLNSCSERLKDSNSKIVTMQGQIDRCTNEKSALQSKVDMAICAPMQPFDSSRTYDCRKDGKVPQIGTFSIREDLTKQQGKCIMALRVGTEGVLNCPAVDTKLAIKLRCNDWVCEEVM